MKSYKLFFLSLFLVLVACDTEQQIQLEGTNWQLTNMIVQGGFVFTPDEPGKYRLNFRSENRLTGTSDCNNLTGAWQQEEVALHLDPFTSTTYLCPPGSLHNYLVLYLRDVAAHEFRDGNMVLTTSTEGVELEFQQSE